MDKLHIHHLLLRLRHDKRAETMLEFAVVGAVFFVMILLIFTVGLDLYSQSVLDDAVRNATRQVQIGEITSGDAFATAVCTEFGIITSIPSCKANLQYNVQGTASFRAITAATLSSSGTLSGSGNFSGVAITASGAPVFILAQVAYLVPFKFINIANGVITENGTPALYSAAAAGAEF